MKDTRNSITNDIHVNLVFNDILDRIFENKELVDDDGQTIPENERDELIAVFKKSIGMRPLTTSVKNQQPMSINNIDFSSKPKNGINLALKHFDEQLQRILDARNYLDIDNLTKNQLDTLHAFSFMLPHMSERLAFEQEKIELTSDRKSGSS
jgi:hypothetical protein